MLINAFVLPKANAHCKQGCPALQSDGFVYFMKVSIQTAQEHLEELIEKTLNGEEVLIIFDDRNCVKLEPIIQQEKQSK